VLFLKIYTKNGDKGYTKNVKGDAVKKSSQILELQGTVDEVNATVGYLRSQIHIDMPLIELELKSIQHALFRLGIDITYGFDIERIIEDDVKALEVGIDRMSDVFAKEFSFLYYSGHHSATYAHVIRATVRRAERAFVRAYEGEDYPVDLQFLNRLADYFYALARYINHYHNMPNEPYESYKSKE
jgi:cob(I)alamin adenosyltransferase